jgi:hypothetical protein
MGRWIHAFVRMLEILHHDSRVSSRRLPSAADCPILTVHFPLDLGLWTRDLGLFLALQIQEPLHQSAFKDISLSFLARSFNL